MGAEFFKPSNSCIVSEDVIELNESIKSNTRKSRFSLQMCHVDILIVNKSGSRQAMTGLSVSGALFCWRFVNSSGSSVTGVVSGSARGRERHTSCGVLSAG